MGCDFVQGVPQFAEHCISIHAPRMGCDWRYDRRAERTTNFNPRTPYGVRRMYAAMSASTRTFQSTHPVWGATDYYAPTESVYHISIHAPRMGCDANPDYADVLIFISIHAPRMGCDGGVRRQACRLRHFNPRTPYGVRPRAEVLEHHHGDFNPRTPYGVRPVPP